MPATFVRKAPSPRNKKREVAKKEPLRKPNLLIEEEKVSETFPAQHNSKEIDVYAHP